MRYLLLALGVIVVLGGAAALRLGGAAHDLRRAEHQLDGAALAIQDGRLADARRQLGSAQALLTGTNNDLHGAVEIDLVSWLPGVRDNIDSLRDSVGLAGLVVNGGIRILEAAKPLESDTGVLDVALSDGTIPLDAVTAAQEEIAVLASQLPPSPDVANDGLLLGPTRELRDAVYEEAGRRREQLDVLSRGLTILQQLAGGEGPRRYLLAVANTAEMRGSGGMILNYGVLDGADGVLDLTKFGRIEELPLDAPVDTANLGVPADYLERWSSFEPTQRWRNATMAGDFTVVAPILEAMYEQASGLPVDGVIQVDPAGLAAVLTGVGPVLVPELGEVRADNVVDLVLNEAYRRFPGIEERSDVLGDVAEAAFRRLVDGNFPSLRPLAQALVIAVDGRHLLLHSKSPSIGAAGAFFGAAGDLPPADSLDYAHLTVQNMSGNKLDYYLDTALSITGDRPAGDIGTWHASIKLTNTAPSDAKSPPYIFGPFDKTFEAGLYRGVVSLYLPSGTSLQGFGGGPYRQDPQMYTEAARPVVGFWVDVPAGQSRTYELDLRLAPRPGGDYQLEIVPSPRVRSTSVHVDVDTGTRRARGDVLADRTWYVTEGSKPRAATVP